MTALERYMHLIAKKKSQEADGKINVSTLLSLEESHLPRIQEIVRILYQSAMFISNKDIDEEIELCAEIVNESLSALSRVEDISMDGITEMGHELANEEHQ